MTDNNKISFLENYVLSSNRLATTSSAFNEDTEEYWQYSLLYILNKSDGAKDAQTQAFLKKLEKSSFKNSDIVRNLLFRQKLKAFDSSSRKELVEQIKQIVGIQPGDIESADQKEEDKASAKGGKYGVGTKAGKKGGIEVDVGAAIKSFLKQAKDEYLNIADYFDPSAVDAIVTKDSISKLPKEAISGILDLLKNSAPTCKLLLELVMRDLKENNTQFGTRAIHNKLTVDQLKKLGEMDGGLYKNIDFVQVMAGKLRPISDVNWQNNEAYCKAYLDKLRAFARGPLKHVTFKALILYNYLRFYEGVALADGNADIAAYQAAVYGNDSPKKSKSSPKFPTYDKDTLAAYLSLPRRGASWLANQASEKAAKNAHQSVDTSFDSVLFPELNAIGDDTAFVDRALGYFFLKGDLTAAWPMVNKEYALVVFAKEKLMAAAGSEKFLKKQEGAIKDGQSVKAFNEFSRESQLRLFETNKKFYRVKDAVTIEYFTKNNPEIVFNVYQLNSKNYYFDHLSEIPVDISLSGAVPLKSMTKKYAKDKSVIRRADSVTIKSLAGKRGIFIIDMIGKNISCRCFIRKGELRFIYEQTVRGYEFYVFDENYAQIKTARIFMDGKEYNVEKAEKKEDNGKSKEGKIVLPYSDDVDRPEQLIIIEDSAGGSGTAVLRSFKRQVKSYDLRGGFYVDRENLLSKESAKLLIRSNLYLCNEHTALSCASNTYVTLEFKTLDGELKKDVRRVQLSDHSDTEIEFTVPTNLREISCRLDATVNGENLNISQIFKVNGIDACPFIADVFLLPSTKNGYYLMTVGKNGEVFPEVELEVSLYHKFFTRNRCVSCVVTTDANGLFELGSLKDIISVKVKPSDRAFFSEKEFNLLQDLVNVPNRICRKEKTTIKIPFSASEKAPKINVYDSQYSSDISKMASYKDGYVVVENLPPGDYMVYIDDILPAKVALHVSGGQLFECDLGNYVLSNSRILQLSEDTPLQIKSVDIPDDSGMKIVLDGYNKMTRCHVVVTSLLPVFTPYQTLCAPIHYPDVIDFVSLSNSTYTPTKKCDSEFMYILNRNKAKATKYNGNNLYKPSMIFGKYAPQSAESQINQPTPAQEEKIRAIFKSRYDNVLEASFASDLVNCSDTSSVEFLPQPSLVFSNLKPDDKGVVTLPDFKEAQYRCVQIIATDDDNTALLNHVIANGAPIGNDMPTSDTRLSPGFDPKKHYSPQRKIQCLNKDETYDIEDFTAAQYIPFEKLSCLFDLYSGLIGENDRATQIEFEKFRPITQWQKLSEEEKLDFYDEYMCNELNYFFYRRDKQFFESTVKPCIQNKIRKEFMDLYLLESSKVERYSDAYLFSTLNTFEQILAASALKDDALSKATLRTIEENAALIPRNPANDDRIFAGSKYRNQVDLVAPEPVVEEEEEEAKDEEVDSKEEEEVEAVPEPVYNPFNFDETTQFEERGYYNVPGVKALTDPKASQLVTATKFWKDFALFTLQDGGKGSFLSPYIGDAIGNNLSDTLLALSVIDLPLDAAEPKITRARGSGVNSGKVTLTPEGGAAIVFLEELVESRLQSSTLSVHSNYFDPRDSSQRVHGEKVDKFVVGTFETRKIYGCRSVITNVSSVEQEIEVLLQIPTGSLPVNQSYRTKSYRMKISPFMTERLTYYFYFPQPSEKGDDFRCFPVHINKNGRTAAYSLDERLVSMQVFDAGSDLMQKKQEAANKDSWEYVTTQGTAKDIIEFISTKPRAYEVDLSKLSGRLAKDPKFFDNVTAELKRRDIYDEKVWKYSLISDKGGAELTEYLSQQNKFLEYIHPFFESGNFNYDPFDRMDWSLTEFAPLISNRVECDGAIQDLSKKFMDEYGKFLLLVAFRSFSQESISVTDKLIFVQYLLYQERIKEAQKIFSSIPEKEGKAASSLYYEYLQSYLTIYGGNAEEIKGVLMKCMSWKAKPLPATLICLWECLENIAKEVEKPESVDAVFDADFIQEEYNKNNAHLDYKFINKKGQIIMDISFRNIAACSLNFYSVDLELFFSESPFGGNDRAKIHDLINLIYPNETVKVTLPKESSAPPDKKYKPAKDDVNLHHYVDLPDNYAHTNCIIEMVAENGISAVRPLNDNSFIIQFAEQLGQCRVVYGDKKNKETFKKPIAGAYCKVYSQNSQNGKAEFYKDGYTDVRGRFGYKQISTNQLANSSKLIMFVKTPNNGSNVVPIQI